MTARIAILLPSLIAGGAERSARFVAIALEQAGFQVDMVVAVVKGGLAEDPFVRAHLVDLKAPNELLALPAYLRYLGRARPDLVISFVHSANLISGLGALFRRGIPYIVSVRNTLIKRPVDQWWVRRLFGAGLERRLYRHAARIQTISDEVADQCRRLWQVEEERLVVTYNSALDPGEPEVQVSAAERKEIEGLGPYLLSVGRLVPIKGFDTLIRALARAELPAGWRLVIVGDGPERDALTRLATSLGVAERVLFAGARPSARPWMEHARGFVFATRGEAFGRVVHEALLASLPIAAAHCPGVNELLDNGRLGRLLPAEDVDGFARAFEDIASGMLGAPEPKARAEHLRRYAPDVVAARYVEMVRAVLGEAHNG